LLCVLCALGVSTYVTGFASQLNATDSSLFSDLKWRHVGPLRAGRVNAVSGAVGQLNTFYFGSVGGGVWKTTNAGRSWAPIFDTANPQIVYAAMWAVRRPPWFIYAPANGPGSGLYKSTDGGTTWNQLTTGLPKEGLGRMGIAVAPSNPRRVYVIADAKEGGLFRSDDGGATFTKASGDPRIWGRGWYFTKVTVDPKNAEVVYVPNTGVYKSIDGGRTW